MGIIYKSDVYYQNISFVKGKTSGRECLTRMGELGNIHGSVTYVVRKSRSGVFVTEW